MVEVVAIIACTIVVIVILTHIKDLLEGKRRTKFRAIKKRICTDAGGYRRTPNRMPKTPKKSCRTTRADRRTLYSAARHTLN